MIDRIRKIQIHHKKPCLVVYKFLNSNSFIGIKGIICIFVLSILQNLWWGGVLHFMHLCVLQLTTNTIRQKVLMAKIQTRKAGIKVSFGRSPLGVLSAVFI